MRPTVPAAFAPRTDDRPRNDRWPKGAQLTAAAIALLTACGGAQLAPEYGANDQRVSAAVAPPPAVPEAPSAPQLRLPRTVEPTAYSVYLRVDPAQTRFSGRVEISVRLDEAMSRIWLHGRGLEVRQAEVLPPDEEPIAAIYAQENADGLASIRVPAPVGPGEVTLSFTYTAPFDRRLTGLYRVDVDDRAYAYTQFEATDARGAFPCFDEPRFKTPFDLTLAIPEGQSAVANTPLEAERARGAERELRFTRTAPLPTYLLAFAVGPLDIVDAEAIPPNGVRDTPLSFRGVATHGRGPELAYALSHTGPLLAALEQYFGTPHPFPKLDVIAVPDFSAGAMENPGAITFRDWLLLIDPERAPEAQRRSFAVVMAHELSHLWFGDLVTMPWWNDLWLNESFATWMAAKVVAAVRPEYRADLSLMARVQRAMTLDGRVSARQIRQPIEEHQDIEAAFDGITYGKGAGVLSMFERFVGAETFREGIQEHLSRHRFGSATAGDLFDALSQMAGQDLGTAMRSFIEQPGLPLLSARTRCAPERGEGGPEGHQLILRQERYLPVGSSGQRDAQTWSVPVCARYAVGGEIKRKCAMLSEREARIPLEGGCPAWLLPDADGVGYYRWDLPEDGWTKLLAGFSDLTEAERVASASNLESAFFAGRVDAGVLLGALERIAADRSRWVAAQPESVLRWLADHAVTDALRPRFERFVAARYRSRARRLGFAPRRGEGGEAALFRARFQRIMAEIARDASTRRRADQAAQRYLRGDRAGRRRLARDAVDLALAVAVQAGDARFFERLRERALGSQDAVFRRQALSALAAVEEPALAAQALALALDPRLRVNEVLTPISVQMRSPRTRDAAFAWLRAHEADVRARLSPGRAGAMPWLAGSFCTAERAAEVEAFFAERVDALPGGRRNLAQVLEKIRLCAAQAEAQRPSLAAFLSQQRP